ncbi:beta-N-acetylhexosaminidase [Thioflexithrix psekupsensis]|uniref:Beta-hexosaminidase n=1 Tax=Thioflexithrix psekupsensis TaxID=1570016 RepID=A0A251X5P2_9GAMM|nr:beta-N-acetylhexosaminidase [Thioflexithrix psekupsensis]OUD12519.1 beta-N-acetylhexosaminidase [Thioflexithrix psekupsensis]
MALGYLMVDIAGTSLTSEDKEVLLHPLVGGVILFSRNYDQPKQLQQLVQSLHALRQPPLLVAVDHEGGRVQRFRQHFTLLPAAAQLGYCYQTQPKFALQAAQQVGWLLAAELRAVGIDFSFAPVLDLDQQCSAVIGNRALHQRGEIVAQLAQSLVNGMKQAGMMAVGKHFPGHGSVVGDSHDMLPVDPRRLVDLQFADLIPFERLIRLGLPAMMPAHVLYPAVDDKPPGFSSYWLQNVLRKQLRFQGVIFSDDLSMSGATIMGDVAERANAALVAGCDMLLVCNDRPAVLALLGQLKTAPTPTMQVRLMRMHGRPALLDWDSLAHSPQWQVARATCEQLNQLRLD